MQGKWKKLVMALVLVVLGLGGVAATVKSKPTWHQGVPTAIKGTWRSNEYQSGNDKYVINDNMLGNSRQPVYYHHQKGSKYYYVKTTVQPNSADSWVAYTWYKVDGNKLVMKLYGEKTKTSHHGKYHKTPRTPIMILQRQ